MMKVLFTIQYDHQETNFMNVDVDLHPQLIPVVDNLKKCKINDEFFFDILAHEAVKDLNYLRQTKFFYRKIVFKSEMINTPTQVKIFNATHLYLNFIKCDLPT